MVTTRRAVIAAGLMGGTAIAAHYLEPKASALAPSPQLEKTVPTEFNGWVSNTATTPLLPDADTQAVIAAIYDETLARTYERSGSPSVMLVIAYGSRQTDSLRAHQPEVCYAAQGFEVAELPSSQLSAKYPLPVAHVYATLGPRTEPIAYWMAVDGEVTNFGVRLKIKQLFAGFDGRIPDGFLVRASLIGPNENASYRQLEAFLIDFLDALPPVLRKRLSGL